MRPEYKTSARFAGKEEQILLQLRRRPEEDKEEEGGARRSRSSYGELQSSCACAVVHKALARAGLKKTKEEDLQGGVLKEENIQEEKQERGEQEERGGKRSKQQQSLAIACLLRLLSVASPTDPNNCTCLLTYRPHHTKARQGSCSRNSQTLGINGSLSTLPLSGAPLLLSLHLLHEPGGQDRIADRTRSARNCKKCVLCCNLELAWSRLEVTTVDLQPTNSPMRTRLYIY